MGRAKCLAITLALLLLQIPAPTRANMQFESEATSILSEIAVLLERDQGGFRASVRHIPILSPKQALKFSFWQAVGAAGV